MTAATVLISGASSGLGRALARAFARQGARLILLSRSADRLRPADIAPGLPAGHLLTLSADVTDEAQVRAAVARARERFPRFDVVVAGAGVGAFGPLADQSAEDVRRVLETNLLGALHLVRAALPALRQSPGGHLVFLASVNGLRGLPRSAAYSASKYALVGLSEALRMELRADGIHVLAVCPGRLRTPFIEKATSTDGRKGLEVEKTFDPDLAAELIVAALRRRQRLLVFPLQARLLHWLNRWSPALTDRVLADRYRKQGLL